MNKTFQFDIIRQMFSDTGDFFKGEFCRWFPLKDEQPPDGAALRVVADSRPAPGVRDLVVAVPRAGRDPVLMHVPLVLDFCLSIANSISPARSVCPCAL